MDSTLDPHPVLGSEPAQMELVHSSARNSTTVRSSNFVQYRVNDMRRKRRQTSRSEPAHRVAKRRRTNIDPIPHPLTWEALHDNSFLDRPSWTFHNDQILPPIPRPTTSPPRSESQTIQTRAYLLLDDEGFGVPGPNSGLDINAAPAIQDLVTQPRNHPPLSDPVWWADGITPGQKSSPLDNALVDPYPPLARNVVASPIPQELVPSPLGIHLSHDPTIWRHQTTRIQEDPSKNEELVNPDPEHGTEIDTSIMVQQRNQSIPQRHTLPQAAFTLRGSPEVDPIIQLRGLNDLLRALDQTAAASTLHRLIIKETGYNTWHEAIERYTINKFMGIPGNYPELLSLVNDWQIANGDEYVAGIWRDDLLRSLLWRREPNLTGTHHPRIRPAQLHAPSWSWISLDAPVRYDLVTVSRPHIDGTSPLTAQIEKVCLVSNSLDTVIWLRGGHMDVRGRVKLYRPCDLSGQMNFYHDFMDENIEAEFFVLSLYTAWPRNMASLSNKVFGMMLKDEGMDEGTLVFRRKGIVGNIPAEWFDDGLDVKIRVV